jgi:hypothetical protein
MNDGATTTGPPGLRAPMKRQVTARVRQGLGLVAIAVFVSTVAACGGNGSTNSGPSTTTARVPSTTAGSSMNGVGPTASGHATTTTKPIPTTSSTIPPSEATSPTTTGAAGDSGAVP